MKNQIVLPASQVKESRISLWLNRENVLFSSIMEEKVSVKTYCSLLSWKRKFLTVRLCLFPRHWLPSVS